MLLLNDNVYSCTVAHTFETVERLDLEQLKQSEYNVDITPSDDKVSGRFTHPLQGRWFAKDKEKHEEAHSLLISNVIDHLRLRVYAK